MAPRLVATKLRWTSASALFGVTAWLLLGALGRWLGVASSTSGRIVVAFATAACLSAWLLGSQERRGLSALRLARTGSPVARGSWLRRDGKVPLSWLVRFRAPAAAVLISDGDLRSAEGELRFESLLYRGGEAEKLRVLVEADLQRAMGGEVGRSRVVSELSDQAQSHPELERYRVHVLSRAILENGDFEAARSVADELARSSDEEIRVYAIWLGAWFDLTHLPAPNDSEWARARLLARTHGADDLVAKLEAREAGAASDDDG